PPPRRPPRPPPPHPPPPPPPPRPPPARSAPRGPRRQPLHDRPQRILPGQVLELLRPDPAGHRRQQVVRLGRRQPVVQPVAEQPQEVHLVDLQFDQPLDGRAVGGVEPLHRLAQLPGVEPIEGGIEPEQGRVTLVETPRLPHPVPQWRKLQYGEGGLQVGATQ